MDNYGTVDNSAWISTVSNALMCPLALKGDSWTDTVEVEDAPHKTNSVQP